jgi:hypothetical protein
MIGRPGVDRKELAVQKVVLSHSATKTQLGLLCQPGKTGLVSISPAAALAESRPMAIRSENMMARRGEGMEQWRRLKWSMARSRLL